MSEEFSHAFSIAPMLEVTDRHCRVFLRLLSRRMTLYTEMKVSGAIIHGDRERLLGFDPRERPLALQLGGADPAELARCAQLAEVAGYDEVNLNVGCPSARVKKGRFGAGLMAHPGLVARCVASMRAATRMAVTVKTRTGIDHRDSYDELAAFVGEVAGGGCRHFIIHARKAWLNGLSPKENRLIPPLHYARVYRLKRDFPSIRFTINGGISTIHAARAHLRHVDGVMIGREAYQNPWMLKRVDAEIFQAPPCAFKTRREVIEAYLPYIEQQLGHGVYLRRMTRHLLGLFHGQPGAKRWRRHLAEHAPKPGAGLEVIEAALKKVEIDGEVEVDGNAVFDADERGRVDVAALARRAQSAASGRMRRGAP